MNKRRVFAVAAALLSVIAPSVAQQQSGAQQATTPAPSQKVSAGGYFRNPVPVLYEFKYLDDESAGAVLHLAQLMFRIKAPMSPDCMQW